MKSFSAFPWLAFVLFLYSTTLPAQKVAINNYRTEKERICREIVPYRPDKELALYQAMDELPRRVWNTVKPVVVEERACSFKGNPHTMIIYRHGKDTEPDEWSLKDVKGEFGFQYDLNGDGLYDYIVYHGGIGIDFTFWFYHWSDRNYDGNIELHTLYQIIPPGDSSVDTDLSVWAYDEDADEKPDSLLYVNLKNDQRSPVSYQNQAWTYQSIFGEKVFSKEDDIFAYPNFILHTLNDGRKKEYSENR